MSCFVIGFADLSEDNPSLISDIAVTTQLGILEESDLDQRVLENQCRPIAPVRRFEISDAPGISGAEFLIAPWDWGLDARTTLPIKLCDRLILISEVIATLFAQGTVRRVCLAIFDFALNEEPPVKVSLGGLHHRLIQDFEQHGQVPCSIYEITL